jgi:hypothetical protein
VKDTAFSSEQSIDQSQNEGYGYIHQRSAQYRRLLRNSFAVLTKVHDFTVMLWRKRQMLCTV